MDVLVVKQNDEEVYKRCLGRMTVGVTAKDRAAKGDRSNYTWTMLLCLFGLVLRLRLYFSHGRRIHLALSACQACSRASMSV